MGPSGLALGLIVRGSVLLGLAGLALAALRHASAATRQTIGVAGLAAALALPPLSFALPHWDLAVWAAGEVRHASTPPELSGCIAVAWVAVAVVLLARVALGMWRVARCARRGMELTGEPWSGDIARAARKLGLPRPVRVVLSSEAKVPMTAGLLEPVVILPGEAAGWSRERLQLVLLHELAHVSRRDWLALIAVEISVATWWFHPLAWLLRRSVRRDAELAADDLVLCTGARPSIYAEHLLEIVRSLRGSHQFESAMAMGRSSDLDGRLLALLERRRRGPASGLGRAIAAALCALALTLATVRATHASAPRPVCPLGRHAGVGTADVR